MRVGEPFSTPKETMRLPALRTGKPRHLDASHLRVCSCDYSSSIEWHSQDALRASFSLVRSSENNPQGRRLLPLSLGAPVLRVGFSCLWGLQFCTSCSFLNDVFHLKADDSYSLTSAFFLLLLCQCFQETHSQREWCYLVPMQLIWFLTAILFCAQYTLGIYFVVVVVRGMLV